MKDILSENSWMGSWIENPSGHKKSPDEVRRACSTGILPVNQEISIWFSITALK
jgi:hypothetical protein